jgi:hypothetical protein
VDPYTGPRDTPGEDDGQPLPAGGYDPRGLPPQPAHDSPRCHVCNGPRTTRHGALMCRVCDAPPIT